MSDSYEQLSGDTIPKTIIRHINRQLLKPGTIFDFQYSCTWKCHARCNHCFIWKKKPTYELTAPDLAMYLQHRALFSECTNLVLTGGDPYERKDLMELLLFFSWLLPKASISTPTNGFWYKRVIEVAQHAQEFGINHITSVSLDGFHHTHNNSRGRELYEKVLKIINTLSKHNFAIDVNITLYEWNLHEFEALIKYLRRKEIYVRVSLPGSNWYFDNLDCEYANVYNHPEVQAYFEKLKHMPFYDKSYMPNCFHGFHTFYMSPIGGIYACQGLPYPIGLLSSEVPFGNIWHSEMAKRVRKQVLKCKGCHTTVERCMNIRYSGTRSKIARFQRKLRECS